MYAARALLGRESGDRGGALAPPGLVRWVIKYLDEILVVDFSVADTMNLFSLIYLIVILYHDYLNLLRYAILF